jgi:hypothetical protein
MVDRVAGAGKVINEEKHTYLHKCVTEDGTYELCVELLRVGLDVNAQDTDGNTALHLAAKAGNLAAAKALVDSGANVVARNKHNRTPRMVVRTRVRVLQSQHHVHGARSVCAWLTGTPLHCVVPCIVRHLCRLLQPKISSEMKDYLYDMEELHKEGKLQKKAELWDDKMKATQTQSAFGLRCV